MLMRHGTFVAEYFRPIGYIKMTLDFTTLSLLGWGAYFTQQLTQEELHVAQPCRVMAVHREHLLLSTGAVTHSLPLTGKMRSLSHEEKATVGDWLLLDMRTGTYLRQLRRKSLFARKAPGTAEMVQLVAANVDTVFIVSSCNADFSLPRLERYLAHAYEAEVTPVIILTKADLTGRAEDYQAKAQSLGKGLVIETVNALDRESLSGLKHWCQPGQTIALMGSSGVGKSTLVTSLGAEAQKASDIREDDARGRHTTTHRSLHPLQGGAVLLDSPGMRELQLFDCETGVETVFEEIILLAQKCRFRDCSHGVEPDCAVQAALDVGGLDSRRFNSFQKLMVEQRHNNATLVERRKSDKALGKLIKSVRVDNRKF